MQRAANSKQRAAANEILARLRGAQPAAGAQGFSLRVRYRRARQRFSGYASHGAQRHRQHAPGQPRQAQVNQHHTRPTPARPPIYPPGSLGLTGTTLLPSRRRRPLAKAMRQMLDLEIGYCWAPLRAEKERPMRTQVIAHRPHVSQSLSLQVRTQEGLFVLIPTQHRPQL